METREMDYFGVDGNVAVVRLPGRKFPGVLVQGDTMKMLESFLDEARTDSDPDGAREALDEATALVRSFLTVFETALRDAGHRLPYATE